MERGKGMSFEVKNLGLDPWLHHIPKLFSCHGHENDSAQGIMRTSKRKFKFGHGRHSVSNSSENHRGSQERVKEMLFLLK